MSKGTFQIIIHNLDTTINSASIPVQSCRHLDTDRPTSYAVITGRAGYGVVYIANDFNQLRALTDNEYWPRIRVLLKMANCINALITNAFQIRSVTATHREVKAKKRQIPRRFYSYTSI